MGPEIDQTGQDVRQVGWGFDPVEPVGLDQAGNDRLILRRIVVAGEETILPRQHDRLDHQLNGIGGERCFCTTAVAA